MFSYALIPAIATATPVERQALDAIGPIVNTNIRMVADGAIDPNFLTAAASKVYGALDEFIKLRDKNLLDDFIVDFVYEPTRDRIMWEVQDIANWIMLAGFAYPAVKLVEDFQPDTIKRIAKILQELHANEDFDSESVYPGFHRLHSQVSELYGARVKGFYHGRGKKWAEGK